MGEYSLFMLSKNTPAWLKGPARAATGACTHTCNRPLQFNLYTLHRTDSTPRVLEKGERCHDKPLLRYSYLSKRSDALLQEKA